MILTRPSTPADLPRQRELWKLAFGDDGAYVDNFYENYYRPDRVVVLEEDGVVQAMTAWFDTTLTTAAGSFKAGYLYAVATHPAARGRGFAGRLLAYADSYLKEVHDCQAVTTVPAEASLHNFFAANGFSECFAHDHSYLAVEQGSEHSDLTLESLSPARYGQLREEYLKGIPHIAYPQEALTYQAGCCAVSGGGLYRLGDAVLCAEGMADGTLLVKELLGSDEGVKKALSSLFAALPNFSGWVRTPGKTVPFGMVKWLVSVENTGIFDGETAYMGLGFD